MLTAESVTDEQIRELLREAEAHAYPGSDKVWRDAWIAATTALSRVYHGMPGDEYDSRQAARARCAEILNARGAK